MLRALPLKAVMARKTWILDTDTKGTGANMVPLDKTLAEKAPATPARPRRRVPAVRPDRAEPVKWSAALPAGHVRKKATGEIGKLQAIDAKAGTATVLWLKRGAASTVPLSAISRR
jgi:hypothetical protein